MPDTPALTDASSAEALAEQLWHAIVTHRVALAHELLAAGANPDARFESRRGGSPRLLVVGLRDGVQNGERALDMAAARDLPSVVRACLERCDANALAGPEKRTALMVAAAHGALRAVEALLPVSDLNIQDHYADSALFLAIEHGHEDVALLLASDPRCDVAKLGGLPFWAYMMWIESGPDADGELPPEPRDRSALEKAVVGNLASVAQAIRQRLDAEQVRQEMERAIDREDWRLVSLFFDDIPQGMAPLALERVSGSSRPAEQTQPLAARLRARVEADAIRDALRPAPPEDSPCMDFSASDAAQSPDSKASRRL
jgi:hypothetical protein